MITSLPRLIRSDWYGWVWKKLNDSDETSATVMPAMRPPTIAAITTIAIRMSATLALSSSSRTPTNAAGDRKGEQRHERRGCHVEIPTTVHGPSIEPLEWQRKGLSDFLMPRALFLSAMQTEEMSAPSVGS